MDNNVKLGKFISLILRHNPDTIGIKLDKNGWANVNELILGINKCGKKIDMKTLEEIVETNNKKRYSFNEDKSKIRANQGHSLEVDVELKESKPPNTLYHGTAKKYLDSIMKKGLQKQNRNHVHLSSESETAFKVGSRHGFPVVLVIDAKKMYEEGYKFYISENEVWLTENVPKEFIMK